MIEACLASLFFFGPVCIQLQIAVSADAWDADADFGEAAGEQWLGLLPQKWNPPRAQLYGWRYDPREFAAARRRSAMSAAGAPHAPRSDAWSHV